MRIAGGIISVLFALIAIIWAVFVVFVGEVGKAVSTVDPTSSAGKDLHSQGSHLSSMGTVGLGIAVLIFVFAIVVIAAKAVWPPAVVLVLSIGLIVTGIELGFWAMGAVTLVGGILSLIGALLNKGKAAQQPAPAMAGAAPGYPPQQQYPQQPYPPQGYPPQQGGQGGGPGGWQGQG